MYFQRRKQRRDTAANWLLYDPVLLEGEYGIEIDTLKQKVGDGVHKWSELEYQIGTPVPENAKFTDTIYDDTHVLKDNDIGSRVQPYDENIVVDANYIHTDNNYTTAEKNKLEGIESNANNYVLPSDVLKESDIDSKVQPYIIDFLESVRFADFLPHYYSIGTPGNVGFGVGVVPVGDLPSYLSPMPGTYELGHDNYGNYQDTYGNIYVCIPKCYYKYNVDNTIEYSSVPKDGYVIERAFINGGVEKRAIFVAKYQGSNNGGIFGSIKGVDPVSTNPDHNPIANINGCSANRYDEIYTACKSIGSDFFATPIFVYSMLARMAKAHAGAANGVANCAWNDIAPYMPKGCNNNALKDANDNSVIYESSGYSNCGKTGSGVPFAKTTHNGQNCGIADINGNIWEIASGFVRDSSDFKILKESVDITTLTKDTAYDYSNYDTIVLSDLISGNDGWIKIGNGSNQVFGFSTDRNNLAYRKTSLGVPLSTGTSSEGTTEFGNDGIYRYLRTDMACLAGGYWCSYYLAGAFSLILSNFRADSSYAVGGRASVFL